MTTAARFRRVVVSVSGQTGAGVYSSAAEIARALSADLAGLFIEDESVIGIADLPFAAVIGRAGTARPLRREDMERAFAAASAGARRRLETAARAARITATFARERGAVGAIIARIAERGDLVIVVDPAEAIERACAINQRFLAAAFASRGSVLYAPEGALAWAGGVAAFVEAGTGRQVLAAAARIAAVRGAALQVIADGGEAGLDGLIDEMRSDLGGAAPQVTLTAGAGGGLAATLAAMPELGHHLIVAARTAEAVASPQVLRTLAARRRAPLLLIEPDPPGA